MKKLFAVVMSVMLGLMAVSCAGQSAAKNIEGDLSALMAQIYANADADAPMTYEAAITSENEVSMLGLAGVPYAEGLVTEPMISTIPHSMILLRMNADADIAKAKADIKANIDPRKWICVGVEPDQVIVDSIGDLVFVVMSVDAAAYQAGFQKLAE